jgi:hypothetical protein
VYIRPKIVGPFPDSDTSGSYGHWAALYMFDNSPSNA